MNEIFEIKDDYIELIKLLKATCLCETGGIAKIVVDDGLVEVNGETEYRKRCKIRKGDTVRFEGAIIQVK